MLPNSMSYVSPLSVFFNSGPIEKHKLETMCERAGLNALRLSRLVAFHELKVKRHLRLIVHVLTSSGAETILILPGLTRYYLIITEWFPR